MGGSAAKQIQRAALEEKQVQVMQLGSHSDFRYSTRSCCS